MAAQRGEEVGHQPLFARRPGALERPLQRGNRLVDVRTGLVAELGGAALGHRLQKVEGAAIDVGCRLGLQLGDALGQLVDGRLLADFVDDPFRRLQVGIDLSGGVARDAVGQAREEAEIAARLVQLAELVADVVLRIGRLRQQRAEGQHDLRVQLRRQLPLVVDPGLHLAGNPLIEPPFVCRLVDFDLGPIVVLAAARGLIPVGQRPPLGGTELVGGGHGLKARNRLR